MKKRDNDMDDQILDDLFDAARATPPKVSDRLMARVIADAETAQPRGKNMGWRYWLRAIGGLPAISGLVTATCVGFWLGVAPPDGMPDLAGQVLGQQETSTQDITELNITTDLSDFGWDIEEGYADG